AWLQQLGFRLAIFPISTLLAATQAMQGVLEVLRREGTPATALGGLPGFGTFLDLVGLPEIRELEARFGGARVP
ncbi:MAG: hypothetical protein J2P57_05360, partial [Acidimicrobiaceae bacterium]|nr:hypothetical protein [Acidimicrobiaceae bacterium]